MATVTPQYSWPVPTSTDYVKDGASAIESLGDAVDATLYTALGGAYPGMRLVKKQTIGSGVSSVTVSDAFSATYDNYKIIVSGGVGSTNIALRLTLGATATGYYSTYVYNSWSGSSVAAAPNNNGTSFNTAAYATPDGIFGNMDLISPFLSKRSFMTCNFIGAGDSGTSNGYIGNTTSYTAFTLTASTGNITGGTIYVYGYGIS